MAFFRRKTDKQEVPPELEPYYDRPNGWRLWVRRIIGFAAVLLLVFLLVWTVAWVYRSVTDGTDTGNDDTTITENGDRDDSENGAVDPNEDTPEEVEPEDERERPADDDDDEEEGLPDTGDAPLPATGG